MRYFKSAVWHVAALMAGNSLRCFQILPNVELQELLWTRAREWHERHIINDVRPEADIETRKRYLINLYPGSNDIIRTATVSENELMRRVKTLKDMEKRLSAALMEAETELKNSIGYDEGIKSNEFAAKWKLEGARKDKTLRVKEIK
jgi:hypothetical protein